MDDNQRNSQHARTPIFYETGPRNGGKPSVNGRVLDPRRLGPSCPRVTVCGIAFRIHGRYYLGNPRGGRIKSRTSVLLHRVVYEAVHGEIPAGCEVHHINDDPYNNHPENLEALPRFLHRSQHKSIPRYECVCRVCGKTFGCYQKFGQRCSEECKRADHARIERERRQRTCL